MPSAVKLMMSFYAFPVQWSSSSQANPGTPEVWGVFPLQPPACETCPQYHSTRGCSWVGWYCGEIWIWKGTYNVTFSTSI